jgi:hypothetical protein
MPEDAHRQGVEFDPDRRVKVSVVLHDVAGAFESGRIFFASDHGTEASGAEPGERALVRLVWVVVPVVRAGVVVGIEVVAFTPGLVIHHVRVHVDWLSAGGDHRSRGRRSTGLLVDRMARGSDGEQLLTLATTRLAYAAANEVVRLTDERE